MENYFLSLSFCLIDKYSLTSYAKAVIKHAWNEQLGRQFVFALGFGLLFHFLLPSSLQHDKSLAAVTAPSQHSPCSICTEAVPGPRAVTGSHEGISQTVTLKAEPKAHHRARQGLPWTKREGRTLEGQPPASPGHCECHGNNCWSSKHDQWGKMGWTVVKKDAKCLHWRKKRVDWMLLRLF